MKADLAVKAREIDTLRTVPFSARSARQAFVDKRKLEAIDQIWAALKVMRQGKSTTALLAVIKWDAVADLTEKDGNAREMFKTMLDSAKITELFNHNAHAAMPYVSPIAAALFSAYATVITFTQAQLVVLQTGLGKNALSSPDAVYKVLSAALPDWSESTKWALLVSLRFWTSLRSGCWRSFSVTSRVEAMTRLRSPLRRGFWSLSGMPSVR